MTERTYIAIDLKSFYASVECVSRGLDPLNTNLVVADQSRTDKTICLAVTPSLKQVGVSGRPRLFEVVQRVEEINRQRLGKAPNGLLVGSSCTWSELLGHPELALDYIVAPPRMSHYMRVSKRIVEIYRQYVSPSDLFVYSVDEVFIDATAYLKKEKCTARELASRMIREVAKKTGITATVGIGTNLYLCKIAMDITAKHLAPDADGVRIAELTEQSYRSSLWDHRPLTDFWRVGRGTAQRLEKFGIETMGDIALTSVNNEALLYRLFGVNAQLLIDHAWGWEPVTIADIRAYEPESRSLSSGQVLSRPYTAAEARLILREMLEKLSMDLLEKRLMTRQLVLTVHYDPSCLSGAAGTDYTGPTVSDRYGRIAPKPAHGTANLLRGTDSTTRLQTAGLALYDRIVDPGLTVRRLTVAAEQLQLPEEEASCQLDLFPDESAEALIRDQKSEKLRQAIYRIRKKQGSNAIVMAEDLREEATAIQRNSQVGGHRA